MIGKKQNEVNTLTPIKQLLPTRGERFLHGRTQMTHSDDRVLQGDRLFKRMKFESTAKHRLC